MAISSQMKTLVASGKFGNAQKNAKDAAEDIEPADRSEEHTSELQSPA